VRSEWSVDGATIAIEYGRPFLKGRREEDMMPRGQPWRTGADAATVLRTDRPLAFGEVVLAPGSYTIFTQPGENWLLILGKLDREGQWGRPYRRDLELHRVPMRTGKVKNSVEQLTISVDDTRVGATLRIEWGTISVTTGFTVLPG
jgi:hypothetical protein